MSQATEMTDNDRRVIVKNLKESIVEGLPFLSLIMKKLTKAINKLPHLVQINIAPIVEQAQTKMAEMILQYESALLQGETLSKEELVTPIRMDITSSNPSIISPEIRKIIATSLNELQATLHMMDMADQVIMEIDRSDFSRGTTILATEAMKMLATDFNNIIDLPELRIAETIKVPISSITDPARLVSVTGIAEILLQRR
jgi:hypothetical protein